MMKSLTLGVLFLKNDRFFMLTECNLNGVGGAIIGEDG
jgi:hypothetical protein